MKTTRPCAVGAVGLVGDLAALPTPAVVLAGSFQKPEW